MRKIKINKPGTEYIMAILVVIVCVCLFKNWDTTKYFLKACYSLLF